MGPVRGARRRVTAVPAAAVLALAAVTAGCSSGTSAAADATSATTAPTTSAPTTSAPAPTTSAPSATPTGEATDPDAGAGSLPPGPTASSTLVPWDEPKDPVDRDGATPSAKAGAADLSILLDDGFGIRATWTLTCRPPGGTHPDPAAACGVLGAAGAQAFVEEPAGECSQEYGGPQKALVTGTWRGKKVRSQFTLENGCEIGRWTAMIGFLPPGGM